MFQKISDKRNTKIESVLCTEELEARGDKAEQRLALSPQWGAIKLLEEDCTDTK